MSSEPSECVLTIGSVEVDVLEPDVELDIRERVLLEELGGGLPLGPVVSLEADGDVQLGVDVNTDHVEIEAAMAMRMDRFDHHAGAIADRDVIVEDDDGLFGAELLGPPPGDRVDQVADARVSDRVTVLLHGTR